MSLPRLFVLVVLVGRVLVVELLPLLVVLLGHLLPVVGLLLLSCHLVAVLVQELVVELEVPVPQRADVAVHQRHLYQHQHQSAHAVVRHDVQVLLQLFDLLLVVAVDDDGQLVDDLLTHCQGDDD